MPHLRFAALFAAALFLLPILASESAKAVTVELAPIDGGSVEQRSGLFGNRYLHDAADPTIMLRSAFTGEGFNTFRGYAIFDISGITQPVGEVTLAVLVATTNGTTLTVNEVVAPLASFLFSFDVLEAPGDPTTNARLLMDDLGNGPLGTTPLAGLAGGGFAVTNLGLGGVGAVSAAQAGSGQVAFGLGVSGSPNPLVGGFVDVLGVSLFVTTVPEPTMAILLVSSLVALRVSSRGLPRV